MGTQFESQLEKYAELIVKVGVNVQKGQEVFVTGAVDVAPLVRLVASKAYEAGAKNVHVDWTDDSLSRMKYEKAEASVFEEYPAWEKLKRDSFVERDACFISIVSSNPDLLKGIDSSRIAAYQRAAGEALRDFRRATQADKVSWTVVAAANKEWAEKVFPDAKGEEAINKLWDAIFRAVRLDSTDPVADWQEHNRILHTKADILNEQRFSELHYRAPGTDLTIKLHEKHLWVAAGSISQNGVPFMANMPTEEVFTVPDRNGTSGYVSSTKPLSFGGNIIDGFTITFENGRIIKTEAKVGGEFLEHLVATDEGSHYLGEVALVPHKSPISDSNILFFNTLFDENASNHLAIGSGYAFNIDGGKQMSREELNAHGVNDSITHNDFMIGSAEMDIDGIKADGTVVPIFRSGNWAV